MNRHLIMVGVVLVVLMVAWSASGQREGSQGREGRRRFQEMSQEERAKLRERFQNMSEEEREKFRAQVRERFGSRGPRMSREEQLKAIKVIEQEVAKLKASMADQPAFDRSRFQEMSEEERAKFREERMKQRQEQRNAMSMIVAQLARLQGQRALAEGEEYLIINTGELKPIHELALKEKAKETAQRLERLTILATAWPALGQAEGSSGRPPGSRRTGRGTPEGR